ncbi:MAG: hypothetical protein RKH07_13910 [Gammaproteobacteria bacterium]
MRTTIIMFLLTSITSATALAQDPFGAVTNEPRPSEYLLWDAETVAVIKAELEQGLENGEGIWGTGFIYERVLQDAEHRPHNMSIVHRSGYTQPEIHETKWDMYVILDGSGTARMGGERIGWIDGLPQDEQHPELTGFQEFQVTKGDILHVPARVWHQLVTEPGTSITYALINIFE